jgi:leucyl aminopeptidase
MPIRVTSQSIPELDVTCLAIGCFENEADPSGLLAGTPLGGELERLVADREVATGVGDTTPVLGPASGRVGSVLAFGLGPRGKYGPQQAFSAGIAFAKKLASRPRERVALVVPTAGTPDLFAALLEGALVGQHGPDLRKSERARHPFGELVVVVPGPEEARATTLARRCEVVAGAVNLARDLVNTPPVEKPPSVLARMASELAGSVGVEVEAWDRERLASERFGGLLGVSAGSDQPPVLVRMSYRRGGNAPVIALVGKGITFDSGGLSLKPSASMEDMKADMTGAAVVLAALRAAAQLGLGLNIEAYLPLAENMTGGRALKLGDVLTHRNGKTVEVLNTDAEGRLVLADALSYAVESQPACVIDLATLTGACMVALGTKLAGLFSPDDALAVEFGDACRRTGERAWRLPLDEDYDEALKSTVADLKNVGGKWGGAITAAKFLQRFVGSTPWLHLDIAGPSWADSDSATRDAGGTGCFTRTLIAWLESRAGSGVDR